MIAVDTNILLYAFGQGDPRHERARQALKELAEGRPPFGVPVFVIAEFLRVATHPRSSQGVKPMADAVRAIDVLLASPAARLLRPGQEFWPRLRQLVRSADARSDDVFDAQIAAVCLENGASTILTEDKGFQRFAGIRVRGLD